MAASLSSSSSSSTALHILLLRDDMVLPVTRGKPTLYDAPVSNHGARVRMLLYAKKLTESGQVRIALPTEGFPDGGLRSEGYVKLSPQGKMPLLAVPAEPATAAPPLAIAESSAVFSYLADRFADVGPSFRCATPEARAVSAMVTCIHDNYISGIQGCLYKQMDANERVSKLKELMKQLDVLENHICVEGGPFVGGEIMSQGDAALFPTLVFVVHCEPKFGYGDVFSSRPKLGQWWQMMRAGDGGDDDFCNRVYDEVKGGLQQWDRAGRWDKLGITEQIEKGELLAAVGP